MQTVQLTTLPDFSLALQPVSPCPLHSHNPDSSQLPEYKVESLPDVNFDIGEMTPD